MRLTVFLFFRDICIGFDLLGLVKVTVLGSANSSVTSLLLQLVMAATCSSDIASRFFS